MTTSASVHRAEGEITARIARLEDRFRNELMDSEERDELRSRIVRLRAKAAGR